MLINCTFKVELCSIKCYFLIFFLNSELMLDTLSNPLCVLCSSCVCMCTSFFTPNRSVPSNIYNTCLRQVWEIQKTFSSLPRSKSGSQSWHLDNRRLFCSLQRLQSNCYNAKPLQKKNKERMLLEVWRFVSARM